MTCVESTGYKENRGLFLESPDNERAHKAVVVYVLDFGTEKVFFFFFFLGGGGGGAKRN